MGLQARGCVGAADLQSCCSGGRPSQTGILNFQFKDDTRVCADLLAGGLDNTTQVGGGGRLVHTCSSGPCAQDFSNFPECCGL